MFARERRYSLDLNPRCFMTISRIIAARVVCCSRAILSITANTCFGMRTPTLGSRPVGGRPTRFFRIDVLTNFGYPKYA